MSSLIKKIPDNFEKPLFFEKTFYSKPQFVKQTEKNSILSMLLTRKPINCRTTSDTIKAIPMTFNYKEEEIKKFDEFNKSLSDISDFDLEKEENDEENSSFNSLDEEDSEKCEEIEIITKSKFNGYINNKNLFFKEYIEDSRNSIEKKTQEMMLIISSIKEENENNISKSK